MIIKKKTLPLRPNLKFKIINIMFAIVEINGQQFKVTQDQEIFVHRLPNVEGANITFDKVLLVSDDKNTQIGNPVLKAKIDATVLGHLKGDKVIVFKKKRKKGYRVKNGHRQYFTKLKINSIVI